MKREKLPTVPQETGVRRHTTLWGGRFELQKENCHAFHTARPLIVEPPLLQGGIGVKMGKIVLEASQEK